jgi:hypothetical protein
LGDEGAVEVVRGFWQRMGGLVSCPGGIRADDVARRGGFTGIDGGTGVVIWGDIGAIEVAEGGEGVLVANRW